jgi:hypothetical protein
MSHVNRIDVAKASVARMQREIHMMWHAGAPKADALARLSGRTQGLPYPGWLVRLMNRSMVRSLYKSKACATFCRRPAS